ncbi:hypothetical protein GX563_12955 [Candidatus Bathyarchaeota archaeon]|nr:hypothetical protein [Candidatus Bathyarchaeota archaeon]
MSSKIQGNEPTIDEPIHVEGHSTEIAQTGTEFMCPECGRKFLIRDEAMRHLHGVHMKHLRAVHGEYHEKDVGGMHVS